ncbi:MAG: PKD domain-containing protein, partial [Pseudomonadales bacterium]
MRSRLPSFLKTATVGLCSLLLVAACGGGSSGSSSNTAQAPPPAPAPPPPPPPPVNQSPVAVFSLSTADGFAPLTITFDSSASQDSDGQITSHLWDFGDGSPTTTGSQVNHVFQAPGSYNVRLTVTDDDGASGTTVNSIRARGAELSGTIRILGSSA